MKAKAGYATTLILNLGGRQRAFIGILPNDTANVIGDRILAVMDGGEPSLGYVTPDRERPVPILLHCPLCNTRHIDEGEFATKPHRDHACQSCGHVWRPALVPTVGVQFLPGYKNK